LLNINKINLKVQLYYLEVDQLLAENNPIVNEFNIEMLSSELIQLLNTFGKGVLPYLYKK